MSHLLPIPFLVVTVTLLVLARLQAKRRLEYLTKPTSTLLVILVALLSLLRPMAQPPYTLLIVLGLVLSLGGDVALMLRSSRMFMIGLVLFLLAHIVYAVTFAVWNGFYPADLVSGLILLLLAAATFLYLRPGLGKMQGPVLLYILVISFMVNRALSTFFGAAFSPAQAWLISLGAILFWLSDLLLAVNRFRRPFRLEPCGLFLYYGGQLLLALSAAYFA
jgi:uncharacterized membrane protein YhhN